MCIIVNTLKMPECKAKFCTVVRGQGISTFLIPDPKKDYKRCARWIHNLGNAKLNIKTFKHSKSMIVCENHFEAHCFKEDMQAKIMGYTPKKKFLRDDAVPTVFADSKPTPERKASKIRIEKKEKKMLIAALLSGRKIPGDDNTGVKPTTKQSVGKKRQKPIPSSSKRSKKSNVISNKTDCGVQVEPTYADKAVSCNIIYDMPISHCTKCFERDHPSRAISDHGYSGRKLQKNSTSVKSK